MKQEQTAETQEQICRKYDAAFVEAKLDEIVGVADNIKDTNKPLNGLRHPLSQGTTGWYIWAGGEPSAGQNFFKPMHVRHLIKMRPELLPYLGLAPGWRFLIDLPNGHEDIWRDGSLLEIED